jgi:hypothetical protein
MDINASNLKWEDISADSEFPRSRLLTAIQFDGVYHHLEAIEVRQADSEFAQSAVSYECEDILAKYSDADAGDGPFNTVTIEGRSYALFVTPFRH